MKKILLALLLAVAPALATMAQTDSLFTEPAPVAYTLDNVPNVYVHNYARRVSDPAMLLSNPARAEIDRLFTALEDSTGIQACVVMLPSIGQADIFDFAHNLFSDWGIGRKKDDTGLLVLYVEDQHAVRFHVGYGLEGQMPDAICKRIQMEKMVPAFKEGDTDRGMTNGIKAICQTLEKAASPNASDNESTDMMSSLMVLLFTFGMIYLFYRTIRSAWRKSHTCPKCKAVGSLKQSNVSSYRDSDGMRHKVYTLVCSQCGYSEKRDIVEDDDDISTGISFGGGSSHHSGGGFSGGSFGGGHSGGGGSTSRW